MGKRGAEGRDVFYRKVFPYLNDFWILQRACPNVSLTRCAGYIITIGKGSRISGSFGVQIVAGKYSASDLFNET